MFKAKSIPRWLKFSFPLLIMVFLTSVVLAIGLGTTFIYPDQVIAAFLGFGSRTDTIIIMNLRLPRVLLAVEVGICLSLAGSLLQTATRNPLASPAILGLVDGAAVGVVLFLILFSNESNALIISVHWQPLAAALGALVSSCLVGWLTWRDRRGFPRMILYGISIAALGSALVTLLIIIGPIYRASQVLIWLTGSVHAAGWNDVRVIGIALLLTLPVLALFPKAIDQLSLDIQSASTTGLAVTATIISMVVIAIILTAIAVSFVGGLGFVGLIAPHVAYFVIGHNATRRLIASAIIGATIVVSSDLLGRAVFSPLEIPVGSITALIGAPYFLFLLIRRNGSNA